MSQGLKVHVVVKVIGPPDRVDALLDGLRAGGVSADVRDALRSGTVAPELAARARAEVEAARAALPGPPPRTSADADALDVLARQLGLAERTGQPLALVDVPGH